MFKVNVYCGIVASCTPTDCSNCWDFNGEDSEFTHSLNVVRDDAIHIYVAFAVVYMHACVTVGCGTCMLTAHMVVCERVSFLCGHG